MSKRTGEVTEDYATYAKHMATAWFIGLISGCILFAIGLWTPWYQQILNYFYANPIIPAAFLGVSAVSVFVYSKVNKVRNRGEQKK